MSDSNIFKQYSSQKISLTTSHLCTVFLLLFHPSFVFTVLLACAVENDKVSDSGSIDSATNDTALETDSDTIVVPAEVVPLYTSETELEPENHFNNGTETAVITRFSDRGRDRHAREDQFQSYDHYLSHYWTHRTARFRFEDTVAHGGSTIEISMVSEWRLSIPEFRAWYSGLGTVASYHEICEWVYRVGSWNI